MFIFALIWLNFSCFSFIICWYDYFWLCFNLCPVLLQSILFWLLCCFNLVFFVCFCVLCMHLWVFCARNVWVSYCYFMCSLCFKFVQPICWVNLLLCYTSLGYATVNESSCATFIYVCFSICGHLNCKLLSVHGGLFQLVFTYIVLVISNKG